MNTDHQKRFIEGQQAAIERLVELGIPPDQALTTIIGTYGISVGKLLVALRLVSEEELLDAMLQGFEMVVAGLEATRKEQ